MIFLMLRTLLGYLAIFVLLIALVILGIMAISLFGKSLADKDKSYIMSDEYRPTTLLNEKEDTNVRAAR